jgi:hypothetical protein
MTSGSLPPVWMLPGAGRPPRMAQRLVAVPWRHPGLVALFALAGAVATGAPWPRPAPAPLVVARARVQPILPAPDVVASAAVLSGADGPGLRLDLELGPQPAGPTDAGAAPLDGARSADASRSPTLRLDDAQVSDDIDTLLARAPAAAGRIAPAGSVSLRLAGRGGAAAAGLVAGLLLGLLAAAAREWRGDRMRSSREAEWALGAPVLGAIPTLPARTRAAMLAPRARRGAAAEPA